MTARLRVWIVSCLTYWIVKFLIPRRVGPVMRLIFRIPVGFHRLGLHFLNPRWILILGTTGRRTGKPRLTALEYGLDPGQTRYFLMSGWGGTSDWYRNAIAHPQVQVWIAGKRQDGIARPASVEEVALEMESILTIAPNAYRTWEAHSGAKYDGTRASLLRMAQCLPSVVINPIPSEMNA
jgi:deazaflavin-dependent oxidoreductase (nitroreductase family)